MLCNVDFIIIITNYYVCTQRRLINNYGVKKHSHMFALGPHNSSSVPSYILKLVIPHKLVPMC